MIPTVKFESFGVPVIPCAPLMMILPPPASLSAAPSFREKCAPPSLLHFMSVSSFQLTMTEF